MVFKFTKFNLRHCQGPITGPSDSQVTLLLSLPNIGLQVPELNLDHRSFY